MTEPAQECQGTWRDTSELAVTRCDGCGEYMVIINGRAFNFPPQWPSPLEALTSAKNEYELLFA